MGFRDVEDGSHWLVVDPWVRGGLAEALPATGTDPGPEGLGWGGGGVCAAGTLTR